MNTWRRLPGWLAGAAILAGTHFAGNWLQASLALPVPGSVLGMLLLVAGLLVYGSVPRGLAEISGVLLRLLALLFLPAATGLFFLDSLAPADWVGLFAATVFGTLASIALCALLLKRLLLRGRREDTDA
ncbi:CidA/LrgA family protein [Microbulbifer yueqingensis]|uniref:CidA/LrgA family protein n=1 Tax=Microbulbifer yueqingensis TaxID=658219 RepID=UPI001C313B62|nr:CidA/LrgA family protein [Microbulbifer yueqingensis]